MGKGDRALLQRVFHKLLLNFTGWVNRKDADGMNISRAASSAWITPASSGTSWMARHTLNLLAIALELASEDPGYEEVASKSCEHFMYIAHAMSHRNDDVGLWMTRTPSPTTCCASCSLPRKRPALRPLVHGMLRVRNWPVVWYGECFR